jgi:hypothetical protein
LCAQGQKTNPFSPTLRQVRVAIFAGAKSGPVPNTEAAASFSAELAKRSVRPARRKKTSTAFRQGVDVSYGTVC